MHFHHQQFSHDNMKRFRVPSSNISRTTNWVILIQIKYIRTEGTTGVSRRFVHIIWSTNNSPRISSSQTFRPLFCVHNYISILSYAQLFCQQTFRQQCLPIGTGLRFYSWGSGVVLIPKEWTIFYYSSRLTFYDAAELHLLLRKLLLF